MLVSTGDRILLALPSIGHVSSPYVIEDEVFMGVQYTPSPFTLYLFLLPSLLPFHPFLFPFLFPITYNV